MEIMETDIRVNKYILIVVEGRVVGFFATIGKLGSVLPFPFDQNIYIAYPIVMTVVKL